VVVDEPGPCLVGRAGKGSWAGFCGEPGLAGTGGLEGVGTGLPGLLPGKGGNGSWPGL
jgi:hypothetical protein